ncbi:MAG: hypothetical protein WCG16_11725, partial [Methylococcales bacterium]
CPEFPPKKLFKFAGPLLSPLSQSQPLPSDSSEIKQLIAMGYEIQKSEKDSAMTIASIDSGRIALSKNSDRIVISRYFTRRKDLNKAQEYELLKIVNNFNSEFSYQVSIGDDYLVVALYVFGPYDAKTFSKLIRLIDKANSIFDNNSELLKLVN